VCVTTISKTNVSFLEAYFAIEAPQLDTQGTLLGVNEFKEVQQK
jgi:hypothetical protein